MFLSEMPHQWDRLYLGAAKQGIRPIFSGHYQSWAELIARADAEERLAFLAQSTDWPIEPKPAVVTENYAEACPPEVSNGATSLTNKPPAKALSAEERLQLAVLEHQWQRQAVDGEMMNGADANLYAALSDRFQQWGEAEA
jgi:hypothetical protein